MLKELIAVGAGGALGSAARYLVSYAALAGCTAAGIPAGTLAVNAAGSLLLGFLSEALRPSLLVWLLCVGFCGGFTTFSTFSAEFVKLVRGGDSGSAMLYAASTVGLCALCTVGGMKIATLLCGK